MEPIVPFTLMISCLSGFRSCDPGLPALVQSPAVDANFAEQGLVAIAMAFSVLSGGIDLSVGSVFAMANFLALYLYLIIGVPLPLMMSASLRSGR